MQNKDISTHDLLMSLIVCDNVVTKGNLYFISNLYKYL